MSGLAKNYAKKSKRLSNKAKTEKTTTKRTKLAATYRQRQIKQLGHRKGGKGTKTGNKAHGGETYKIKQKLTYIKSQTMTQTLQAYKI